MIINWTGGSQEITVDDSSYRLRKIMGANNVMLNFSLATYVEIPLGAYISYEGQTYILNTPQKITELNSTNFSYKLVFGSYQDNMINYKIKDVQGGLKFPFTAKPSEHIQLILDVLNTFETGWTLGNCVVSNEKLISYNHTNCLDALQTIAKEFETEWEVVGKTINLGKLSYNEVSPLALSYGKGNGFKSGVGRTNDSQKKGFNVLYVQGGDRNIDFSVYGSKDLLLPKNQTYSYLGNTYLTDANGLYIVRQGITITNRKEESLDRSNIYPQRKGTVSGVEVVDALNNFYDIFDTSIPEDLDFSTLRMNGERMTIYFESGNLAGREFDILQSDTAITGYVHTERRFVIVPKEEDGYTMPNGVFIPQVGDIYSIYGMMLPLAYISDNATKTGASWDMFKEAAAHFYENEESSFTFKGSLDGIWAKKDWVNIGGKIVIGGYVAFSDAKFQQTGINIRIVSVKDFINTPHSPVIELANSVQAGGIVSEIDKIREQEVVQEALYDSSLEYTRRYFRDARESIRLLQESLLNFDGGIQPVTVDTMQLLVGDKSLQFRWVNAPQGNEVIHTFVFDEGTKVFSTDAGILQHLTLEIDAIRPNQIYKEWSVTAYSSAVLTVPDTSYYFYAKVSKTLTTGVFLLSETAIALEEVTGYYHLLVGLLNSEYQGGRAFARMYGFTEILPGQIKVDRLTSGDSTSYIQLLQNAIDINARVTFTNDSPALAQTRDNTVSTLQIGAHNLILDSAETKEYYSLSIEQRDRYFDQLRFYTISIDLFSATNFTGKIKVIGHLVATGTTILGEKDITLVANEKQRLHITFECQLVDYTQFEIIVVDAVDTEAIGVVLFQPKLELGEIATDWDVADEDTINAIQSFQDDLKYILYNYQDNIDEFFRDGIITEAEATAIRNYKNALNSEKAKIDIEYTKLYANVVLTGTAKTNLFDKKALFDTAHNNLISTIDTAITDGKATAQESADVDAKFILYALALQNYATVYEDAKIFINDTTTASLQQYVDDALANFDGSVGVGFRDGIITEAEANSIENYNNILDSEKQSLDSRYALLYANDTLIGTQEKTNLFDTKALYDTAHSNLITSINTAIADGVTTQTEKNDVNAKFILYRDALTNFIAAFEIASRFVTDADIAGSAQDVTSILERVAFLSETKIDGNVVATGILAVGNQNGANTFISGLDVGANAIRIAAGSTWANRNNAPFRVLDDGSLYATKGIFGQWNVLNGEIYKGGIHINSVRPAIEVYDSNGKLAVDINAAEQLSPLVSSTIAPSSTTIVGSSNGSYTSPNGSFATALQTTNPEIYSSPITFIGVAGKTCTLSFDLFQNINTKYYIGTYSGGNTPDVQHWSCEIGIEIELPDTTKIYTSKLLTYPFSGYASHSINKSLDMVAGTYKIRTFIKDAYYTVLWWDGPSGTANVYWRTPQLRNLIISLDADKTEIIPGGMQVVKSATQYFRVDKNASDVGTGTALITSGGWYYHTGTFTQTSDKRQKFNIERLNIDLKLFKNIKSYKYNQILNPIDTLIKVKEKDIEIIDSVGLMAQEIEAVLPEAVFTKEGVKSIENSRVTAMLFNVVNQLLEKVDVLEKNQK